MRFLCPPFLCAVLLAAGISSLRAQTTRTLAPWQGGAAGEVTFTAPAGSKGWWSQGFRREHDGTVDGLTWAQGLQLEIETPEPGPVALTLTVRIPPMLDRQDYLPQATAVVRLAGPGSHALYVPWTAFAFPQAQPAFLKFIQSITLAARTADGRPASVQVRRAALARGETLALSAPVRGQAVAGAGEGAVRYALTLHNCTSRPQAVALDVEAFGWEAMTTRVTPATVDLAPGATAAVEVEVTVPARVPPGGREKQAVRAVAGDGAVTRLELTTARDVAHPYLLHTAARWAEVRAKVRDHAWAREAQEAFLERARAWVVPEVFKEPRATPAGPEYPLFVTSEERNVVAAGIAYQLTGDKAAAEKVAVFLRRLSDPATGYPRTLRGSNQGLVQEGHFFQHLVEAYDMIHGAGVLSAADHAQIAATLRLYMGTIDFESDVGNISNWNIAELAGALNAALVLGDWERVERFYAGRNGVLDQFGKGVMDDGWWYECSISYNGWMAQLGTMFALVLEPWGVNLRDARIPASFTPNYGLIPWAAKAGHLGMSFDKFGPVKRPYVQIRDLWDGFLPFVDHRGIMFGANDADEKEVAGNLYELAYYVYRDPKYAAMIKLSKSRDLLWGVPALPVETPLFGRESAAADNAGVVVLRGQNPAQPQDERIQAVLKYGTHGGYHGHFDRASLLAIFRHGRSFFHPEMTWFGYGSFLYKFYVQTSLTKNMVVVDRKMQEPVDSRSLLFHTGPALQASAVETVARWSYPPYLGMVYAENGAQTAADKIFTEGRAVLPAPAGTAPAYGSVTGFTEPVRQRRLMVVTDDYVLLADALRSENPHTFDALLQIKGFRGIEAPRVERTRRTPVWDADPLNAAQFVTGVDWYGVEGAALARFEMVFGETREPGADPGSGFNSRNTPGPLRMNVHALWPLSREMFVGDVAESLRGNSRRLVYRVRAGETVLAEGRTGAWVLGTGAIDVPVDGQAWLELEVDPATSKAERKTLFWAAPRVVLADGRERELPAEALTYTNVVDAPAAGTDYEGGPLRLAGVTYAQAWPAEPRVEARPAVVRVDLTKVPGATRFRATVGSDYPVGDERWRRKTFGVQVHGTAARFLTVIEPFVQSAAVVRAEATGPDRVRIELADGRVQELAIRGLDGEGGDVHVRLVESKAGQVIREEDTGAGG